MWQSYFIDKINKILKSLKSYIISEGFKLKSVQKVPASKKSPNIKSRQMICTAIQLFDFYITRSFTVTDFSSRL